MKSVFRVSNRMCELFLKKKPRRKANSSETNARKMRKDEIFVRSVRRANIPAIFHIVFADDFTRLLSCCSVRGQMCRFALLIFTMKEMSRKGEATLIDTKALFIMSVVDIFGHLLTAL